MVETLQDLILFSLVHNPPHSTVNGKTCRLNRNISYFSASIIIVFIQLLHYVCFLFRPGDYTSPSSSLRKILGRALRRDCP